MRYRFSGSVFRRAMVQRHLRIRRGGAAVANTRPVDNLPVVERYCSHHIGALAALACRSKAWWHCSKLRHVVLARASCVWRHRLLRANFRAHWRLPLTIHSSGRATRAAKFGR